MSDPHLRPVPFAPLVARHRALFFDSYGVLRDNAGVTPGVEQLLARLEVPFWVITNDASRAPAALASAFGAAVRPEQVVASGSLLTGYLRTTLPGRFVGYLGNPTCEQFLADSGNPFAPLPALEDLRQVEVVALMDEAGWDWPRELERVVNLVRARPEVQVFAPNPDVLYPARDGLVGLGTGSLVALLTRALERPVRSFGKPDPAIFQSALERARQRLPDLEPEQVLMVGDTLFTDIAGAQPLGLHTALTLCGNTTETSYRDEIARLGVEPTWVVHSVLE